MSHLILGALGWDTFNPDEVVREVDTLRLVEEDTMPRSRPPYSPEYRQQMVDLVRGGRTPDSLSREFELTAQSIWNWVRQAERDEGTRTDGLMTEEKEELRRLRRENR